MCKLAMLSACVWVPQVASLLSHHLGVTVTGFVEAGPGPATASGAEGTQHAKGSALAAAALKPRAMACKPTMEAAVTATTDR